MTSAAGSEQLRGIGARLRAAREQRGLTTLQAAEKLHVDARVLEALEAEDFAALGAVVYARGHLRRYADLVGESPSELQRLYDDSAHAPQPDLTRIPHRERSSDPKRLAVPAALILVGFALAGLLWWVLTLQGGKPQPLQARPALPAAAAAAGADERVGTPTANAGEGTQPLTGAIAGGEPSAAQPHETLRIADASGAPGTAGQAQLALRFSAPSWVEVYDAGGRRLLQGIEVADSARTLAGPAPLRVVLGNAPGVAVRLNGQPVTLDALVHRNGSARVVIDGSGRVSPAAHSPGPGG